MLGQLVLVCKKPDTLYRHCYCWMWSFEVLNYAPRFTELLPKCSAAFEDIKDSSVVGLDE